MSITCIIMTGAKLSLPATGVWALLAQVNVAVDMLHAQVLSLRRLEDWLTAERQRKAQEEAETKDLDEDAKAQVHRTRQRWCIGSGKCLRKGRRYVFCQLRPTACTRGWPNG